MLLSSLILSKKGGCRRKGGEGSEETPSFRVGTDASLAVGPQIPSPWVVSYLKSLLKGCLKPVGAKKIWRKAVLLGSRQQGFLKKKRKIRHSPPPLNGNGGSWVECFFLILKCLHVRGGKEQDGKDAGEAFGSSLLPGLA